MKDYCEVIFNRYKNKVKYWLTFNEINMIITFPFYGCRFMYLKKVKIKKQVKYQAAHHELVASALATKISS